MSPVPHVTNHALRRYGDRVLGLPDLPRDDAEAVAQMRDLHRINLDQIAAFVRQVVARGVIARAPAVRFGGFRFFLEGAVVTTIVVAKRSKRRRPRIVRESLSLYGGGSWRELADV